MWPKKLLVVAEKKKCVRRYYILGHHVHYLIIPYTSLRSTYSNTVMLWGLLELLY